AGAFVVVAGLGLALVGVLAEFAGRLLRGACGAVAVETFGALEVDLARVAGFAPGHAQVVQAITFVAERVAGTRFAQAWLPGAHVARAIKLVVRIALALNGGGLRHEARTGAEGDAASIGAGPVAGLALLGASLDDAHVGVAAAEGAAIGIVAGLVRALDLA